jgi:hypothetical protein
MFDELIYTLVHSADDVFLQMQIFLKILSQALILF